MIALTLLFLDRTEPDCNILGGGAGEGLSYSLDYGAPGKVMGKAGIQSGTSAWQVCRWQVLVCALNAGAAGPDTLAEGLDRVSNTDRLMQVQDRQKRQTVRVSN